MKKKENKEKRSGGKEKQSTLLLVSLRGSVPVTLCKGAKARAQPSFPGKVGSSGVEWEVHKAYYSNMECSVVFKTLPSKFWREKFAYLPCKSCICFRRNKTFIPRQKIKDLNFTKGVWANSFKLIHTQV